MRDRRVIVVGAGIGGLAAALRLAARGVEVLVLDRQAGPGGKMLPVRPGGTPIDAGPTVLTMRWVFEDLLEAAGTSLDAELDLKPLGILARHAWPDGSRLDLHSDPAATSDAIGDFAGAGAARDYLAFRDRAARIYRALEAPFIKGTRPSLPALLWRAWGAGCLGEIARISPFSTMWDALGAHFRDQRLRQLFARYATYCGSSPFAAPATLMLVAHVEQQGVWDVAGGMGMLAGTLARVAARLGARFRHDADVAEVLVEGGRAVGVRLADGERIDADSVILTADCDALARGLFGKAAARGTRPMREAARSLSAVTWAMAARTEGFPLVRHNVFFSPDYAAEFRALSRERRVPAAPTIYVCAGDRDDAARGPRTPGAAERLLVLVNAPALRAGEDFPPEEIERCAHLAFGHLEACGLTITRTGVPVAAAGPADHARRYPATGGALYGRAAHGWRASFRRPGARTGVPGLYLAGGSVHPGPGVPMAALSGGMAAASLLGDWGDRASTV